jgi:hypothetical protein
MNLYFANVERSEFNLGVQTVAIIIFFNKIEKLPTIRYHTRGSQKLTQYVSQIFRTKIERISQIVTFSKNVRAFTECRHLARSLNLTVRIFGRRKQILSGIEN